MILLHVFVKMIQIGEDLVAEGAGEELGGWMIRMMTLEMKLDVRQAVRELNKKRKQGKKSLKNLSLFLCIFLFACCRLSNCQSNIITTMQSV